MSQVMASLLCCVSVAAPAPAPANAQPDMENYCVVVQQIVEGRDLAIYGIQILTEGKRGVYLHLEGGTTREGHSQADPDGKLHRAEFVLEVSLRPSDNPTDAKRAALLERRIRVSGTEGGMYLTN